MSKRKAEEVEGGGDGEWQVVGGRLQRGKKKAKLATEGERVAQSVMLYPNTFNREKPSLSDVQNFLLRIFTTEYGENAKWTNVKGMSLVRSAVVVATPCVDSHTIETHPTAMPVLNRLILQQSLVQMRSAGEIEHFPRDLADANVGCRMLRLLLSARAKPAIRPKGQEPKVPASAGSLESNRFFALSCPEESGRPASEKPASRPPIAHYVASELERKRNGYPSTLAEGWAITKPPKTAAGAAEDPAQSAVENTAKLLPAERLKLDPDYGRLVAIDCEMVKTASGLALARVSAVNATGDVLYDTLVKPEEEVIDYVTQFSGITAEMLGPCEVTLREAQKKLKKLVNSNTILVGHSLQADLNALQLIHERVVDTSIIFPHPRGWPHRQGLAHLAKTYLKREMKREDGHDSIMDARTTMDLALLRFEKGASLPNSAPNSASLGKLLKGSGVELKLIDPGPAIPEPSAAWYLENCDYLAVADDEAAARTAVQMSEEMPGQPGAGRGAGEPAQASSAAPQQVRLVMLREFERCCCEESAAATGARDPEECLRRLDAQVATIASALGPEELLFVLNGSGNLHKWRRCQQQLAEAAPPESKGDRAVASKAQLEREKAEVAFKSSFGFFAAGGAALAAKLGLPARDAAGAPSRTPASYE